MKAIITVGISASGKTTWAKEQTDYRIVCRDDIRRSILEQRFGRPLAVGELWGKWKWRDEDQVTAMVQELISSYAADGQNIIIADTNLVPKYRTLTANRLTELGYEVEIKTFPITFEEAVKRDNARPDGVGHSVIMKQWMQFNAEFGYQPYEPKNDTPSAVVCDLDGTLAHMTGRGAFEWSRVGEDSVDLIVKAILDTMVYEEGYQIILLSGRDSVCRPETMKWLDDNNINYHHLFMRAENDSRKDVEVKYELFNAHVRDNFNVRLVIDDRPQVVRLWQTMGLKTVTMGNPWIEF